MLVNDTTIVVPGISSVSQSSSLYIREYCTHDLAKHCCVGRFFTEKRTAVAGVTIIHITAWYARTLQIRINFIIVDNPGKYDAPKLNQKYTRSN